MQTIYLQRADTRDEYPEQTAFPVLSALPSSAADEMSPLKYASVSYAIFDVTHLQSDRTLYKSDWYGSVRYLASSSNELAFSLGA